MNYKIQRMTSNEKAGDRVNWLDEFANSIDKAAKSPVTAVEAARIRNEVSIIDQISAIIGRGNNFNSVDQKVKNYQNMIGLTEHLQKLNQEIPSNTKKAQETPGQLVQNHSENNKQLASAADTEPDFFKILPKNVIDDIKIYLTNICDTHYGNIQIPAIVQDVLSIFSKRGVKPEHVNDRKFEKFISNCILDSKKRNPEFKEVTMNLGKGLGVGHDIDGINNEAFENINVK